MGHWQAHAPSGVFVYGAGQPVKWDWAWEDGDAPAGGAWGYSHDALSDHNQTPDNYKAPPPPAVPSDVALPTLTFDAGWLPDITGDLPGGDEAGSPAPKGDHPPPSVAPFRVALSSVRDTEISIKAAVGEAVDGPDGYRDLKAYYERVKPWIFYRPEHLDLPANSAPAAQSAYPTDESRHAPPSQDAKDMEAVVSNLVAGGASALMPTGALLEHMNAAAQMYAAADKQSTFPNA